MKSRYAISLILFIVSILTIDASPRKNNRERHGEWAKEMLNLKNEYIVKALDLSGTKKTDFIDIYSRMNEQLLRVQNEVREKETEICNNADATEADYETVLNAQLDLKRRESEIEKQYYGELSDILTKEQLFKLKRIEREFMSWLMSERDKRRPPKE